MKFFGREKELQRLREISHFARSAGYFTMITGRRRVGETTLVRHFLQKQNLSGVFFFISRKQPRALLNEFAAILSETFPEISGLGFNDFDSFFKFLFERLKRANFTLVLDEFQNFQHVDSAVFSILQKYWDREQNEIDVIAYQDSKETCLVGECKWNHKKDYSKSNRKAEAECGVHSPKTAISNHPESLFRGKFRAGQATHQPCTERD